VLGDSACRWPVAERPRALTVATWTSTEPASVDVGLMAVDQFLLFVVLAHGRASSPAVQRTTYRPGCPQPHCWRQPDNSPSASSAPCMAPAPAGPTARTPRLIS